MVRKIEKPKNQNQSTRGRITHTAAAYTTTHLHVVLHVQQAAVGGAVDDVIQGVGFRRGRARAFFDGGKGNVARVEQVRLFERGWCDLMGGGGEMRLGVRPLIR